MLAHHKLILATLLASLLSLFILNATAVDGEAESQAGLNFDDTLLESPLEYPDWFKLSLGDFRDDLDEAVKNGKDGLIIYFGQKRCAYCQQFFETNLAAADTERYIRAHYDMIPIDIWGIENITDTDGKQYTERELSVHYKTNFTPSLVFYDNKGKPVFRLRGYYPPYKFKAALKFVVEGFYKEETFREYLERAEPGMFFMAGGLNERDFFIEPPYDLQKLSANHTKPLVVFFEQGECHTCDLLHTGPLNKDDALEEIAQMNAVQLDMWADTPVITPDGEKTTARDWAKKLGLFYPPTLLFFDPDGKEIIRLDSVIQFYRLWGVLDYMNKQGYKTEPDYQAWRLKQRKVINSK
ncbi:MAG: thioredoxin fold domain-containing protein [Gammaproteobacteria bacterium]